MRLDHVQLAAPPGAEEGARRFFGELLGLEEIAKPEALAATGGVWFKVGDQELHVGIEQDFTPARKAHPGLGVHEDELEAIAARLADAGAPVDWDDRYPGRRRFYTADPFGNRIELFGS